MILRIDTTKILNDVDFQTYYIGERRKRADLSFSEVQTSTDNYDVLAIYVETAVNEIVGRILTKVDSIDIEHVDGCIQLSMSLPIGYSLQDKADIVLTQAISDYVRVYVIYQWLLTVAPDIAQNSAAELPALSRKVDIYISMLGGKFRRRATDLAGI